MSELVDRCRNRWPSILRRVGVPSKFLTGKHGPCPFCQGGKDRFRFDDKEGNGGWICSICGAGNGWDFVRRYFRTDFADAAKRIEAIMGESNESKPKERRSVEAVEREMRGLWESAREIAPGSPVDLYFRRRSIALEKFPAVLRWTDDGHYPGIRCGAMLAKMVDGSGRPCNIHRTFLTMAGERPKLDRLKLFMDAPVPDGCAIRLGKAGDALGVAEGVETALSASILFKVPVWAFCVAQNLAKFNPPSSVKRLLIFGDNDASYSGHAAGYALAKRAKANGLEVEPKFPEVTGQDWNDVLAADHGAEESRA